MYGHSHDEVVGGEELELMIPSEGAAVRRVREQRMDTHLDKRKIMNPFTWLLET